MLKTFLTLLPRGSFFTKIGKRIQALIKGICWQFQQVLNFYKIMGKKEISDENLEMFSEEFDVDIRNFSNDEAKILINFLKFMPMKPNRKSFFDTLLKLFPRLRIYRDYTTYLRYQLSQVNVFETKKSQLAGLDEDKFRKDNVFIAGTVKNLFDKRRLKWFLERYGRAKHKHIISVTTEESEACAICGVAQVGVMIIGSTHPGVI